jgi:5-amino-6-(5-phosphoribosylamino)uracil reductase
MKITTLFERMTPLTAENLLSETFTAFYDGKLVFSSQPNGRPLIIGNFVQTLDGIVSFKIPHQSGGGVISGSNEEDRFIMAFLRACADAVIVASGTLHEDPGHVWTPEFIYPPMAEQFVELRTRLGKKSPHPLNVIVSGSGRINLAEKVFWTRGVRALILTTTQGQAHLLRQSDPPLSPTTDVRALPGQDALEPRDIASALYGEYEVNLLLHEGGPTFFSSFLTTHLVDELFLTIAPQIAGSGLLRERPAFAVAANFDVHEALQGNLMSVKRPSLGSHLYLRYRLSNGS